jgi:hypothetical protein
MGFQERIMLTQVRLGPSGRATLESVVDILSSLPGVASRTRQPQADRHNSFGVGSVALRERDGIAGGFGHFGRRVADRYRRVAGATGTKFVQNRGLGSGLLWNWLVPPAGRGRGHRSAMALPKKG